MIHNLPNNNVSLDQPNPSDDKLSSSPGVPGEPRLTSRPAGSSEPLIQLPIEQVDGSFARHPEHHGGSDRKSNSSPYLPNLTGNVFDSKTMQRVDSKSASSDRSAQPAVAEGETFGPVPVADPWLENAVRIHQWHDSPVADSAQQEPDAKAALVPAETPSEDTVNGLLNLRPLTDPIDAAAMNAELARRLDNSAEGDRYVMFVSAGSNLLGVTIENEFGTAKISFFDPQAGGPIGKDDRDSILHGLAAKGSGNMDNPAPLQLHQSRRSGIQKAEVRVSKKDDKQNADAAENSQLTDAIHRGDKETLRKIAAEIPKDGADRIFEQLVHVCAEHPPSATAAHRIANGLEAFMQAIWTNPELLVSVRRTLSQHLIGYLETAHRQPPDGEPAPNKLFVASLIAGILRSGEDVPGSLFRAMPTAVAALKEASAGSQGLLQRAVESIDLLSSGFPPPNNNAEPGTPEHFYALMHNGASGSDSERTPQRASLEVLLGRDSAVSNLLLPLHVAVDKSNVEALAAAFKSLGEVNDIAHTTGRTVDLPTFRLNAQSLAMQKNGRGETALMFAIRTGNSAAAEGVTGALMRHQSTWTLSERLMLFRAEDISKLFGELRGEASRMAAVALQTCVAKILGSDLPFHEKKQLLAEIVNGTHSTPAVQAAIVSTALCFDPESIDDALLFSVAHNVSESQANAGALKLLREAAPDTQEIQRLLDIAESGRATIAIGSQRHNLQVLRVKEGVAICRSRVKLETPKDVPVAKDWKAMSFLRKSNAPQAVQRPHFNPVAGLEGDPDYFYEIAMGDLVPAPIAHARIRDLPTLAKNRWDALLGAIRDGNAALATRCAADTLKDDGGKGLLALLTQPGLSAIFRKPPSGSPQKFATLQAFSAVLSVVLSPDVSSDEKLNILNQLWALAANGDPVFKAAILAAAKAGNIDLASRAEILRVARDLARADKAGPQFAGQQVQDRAEGIRSEFRAFESLAKLFKLPAWDVLRHAILPRDPLTIGNTQADRFACAQAGLQVAGTKNGKAVCRSTAKLNIAGLTPADAAAVRRYTGKDPAQGLHYYKVKLPNAISAI